MEINFANSVEFFTYEEVFPNKGDKMVTRCFDSWYVGELTTNETIVRAGCSFFPLMLVLDHGLISCKSSHLKA